MYNADGDTAPINPLPPVVVILVVLVAAVEAIFQLGEAGLIGGATGPAWRIMIADQFGFSNAAVYLMWDTGQYPADLLVRFVTYMFIHTNFVAALFSVVFMLALGKFVGERVHWLVFLVIFFGSGILSALAQAIVMGPTLAMLGAGAPSYGLIGALSWILFTEQRATGQNGLRAFRLIAALGILLAVFSVMFGGHDWFERVAGFAFGFVICAVLRPVAGAGLLYWRDRLRRGNT